LTVLIVPNAVEGHVAFSAYGTARFCKVRCQANSAHIRQSRQDYGFSFEGKVLETFQIVPVLGALAGRVAMAVSVAVSLHSIWHI